jgi:membrane protease subunit (stomatin/prohibitin family)
MVFNRGVISSLNNDSSDMLGASRIALKLADEQAIVSGSLLTVESNHFAVVKMRGAVLNVYETGQYSLTTQDKPIIGSIVQSFWSGRQAPWQYEIIYVNRSKLLVCVKGRATSSEMAEVEYEADFYIHIDTKADVLQLIQHLPFNGLAIDTNEIAFYARPVIEQSVNQILQVTKFENINEHMSELIETVKGHLTDFLHGFGVHLNDLKVIVRSADERMREIISLTAMGLSPLDATRMYLALKMAEKGLVSAPNAAIGQPYNIGASVSGLMVPGGK